MILLSLGKEWDCWLVLNRRTMSVWSWLGLFLLCFIFVRERSWTLFSLSWVRLVHGQLTVVVVVLHREEMKDRILVELRWNSLSYVASFGCGSLSELVFFGTHNP